MPTTPERRKFPRGADERKIVMTEVMQRMTEFSMGEQVEITKAAGELMTKDKTLNMTDALNQVIDARLEEDKR